MNLDPLQQPHGTTVVKDQHSILCKLLQVAAVVERIP
jgi:hypothetical protein